jgi:F-type H+-transporting ATPase subunit gamma
MPLKQIKNKIVSTLKTGKVTKAMEAVSAVKMRKSQLRALQGKPYAEAAIRILHRVSKSKDAELLFNQPKKSDGAHCFVVITSDKGLAGSLSSTVIKNVMLQVDVLPKDNVRVIAFGRKAVEHFKREGYTIDGEFTNVSDDVALHDMEEVTRAITRGFKVGEYSSVSIAYQSFVSTFEQNALVREVLPLDPMVLEMMVRDIVPKKGAYSGTEKELENYVYTVEPSPEEVMAMLVPQLVKIMIYHAMLENKASEHSARMVAMKNATDKAKEITKELTIKFNKERQSTITAEVSEITGGIEAMK